MPPMTESMAKMTSCQYAEEGGVSFVVVSSVSSCNPIPTLSMPNLLFMRFCDVTDTMMES